MSIRPGACGSGRQHYPKTYQRWYSNEGSVYPIRVSYEGEIKMAVCTDSEILTQMFTDNIRLAYYIAEKWRVSYPIGIYADVIQEAHLGLWKACRSYDPDKGAKFS